MKQDDQDRQILISHRTRRLRLLAPLLLLPLLSGCLTTLAITAATGGGGANSEHIEQVKETAKDVADHARDAADHVAESAEDAFDSVTGND